MKREQAIQITFFILRVVVGLLFLQHGGSKLLGWFGVMPPGDLPPKMQVAGYLESIGGTLILLGLFSRLTAFVLAGEMAVAYFQGHQPHGTWPIQNHGEPAVLFCFIFLYMAAYGAGQYSLDALISRKRAPTETANG